VSEEASPSSTGAREREAQPGEGEADTAKTDEAPAEAAESAPKPKKKKKRQKAPPREGVPAFARSFPRDPVLDVLVDAFEHGDYAKVRSEAPRLAKETDRDDVRAAARELARRIEPDPLAAYLLAGAAALLAFLAIWYWTHPHATP
jgi:hypothetical protein